MQQLRRFQFFDLELVAEPGPGPKQPQANLEALDITCWPMLMHRGTQ